MLTDFDFIDTNPDGTRLTGGTKVAQGPFAALQQLPREGLGIAAMRILADIVNEQDIDPVQTETLIAVLHRSHDPIITVVVCLIKGQGINK